MGLRKQKSNAIRVFASVAGLAAVAWATIAGAQSAGDFDLYVLDTLTGEVEQVSFTPGLGDYNGSFSNNGKKVVHDLFDESTFSQELAITDLTTHETVPLGLAGDNAVWSPNGNYIAYGNFFDPNAPVRLIVVPSAGGDPVMTRDWALDPSWSNNSRRIAFTDLFDGAIGTVGLDGSETLLDSVIAYGCNPDYSPDGKMIVYENWECFWGAPAALMAVPVDEHGMPLGDPYPLTSGDYYAAHPSFSNDGKSIVFSADPDWDGDFGLYTVSVFGGSLAVLRDEPGIAEYDPAFSKNGRHVVFSSHAEVNP